MIEWTMAVNSMSNERDWFRSFRSAFAIKAGKQLALWAHLEVHLLVDDNLALEGHRRIGFENNRFVDNINYPQRWVSRVVQKPEKRCRKQHYYG